MAKLFRKIRREMLTQDRLVRYSVYALGEIFLVVIGILIALTLNNLNDEINNRSEEKEILKNLKANLLLAKEQSEYNFEDETALKSALLFLLNISPADLDSLEVRAMDSIFYTGMWNLETDMPVFNVYEDIQNTGKVKLISNDAMRQRLTIFEENLDLLQIMVDDRLYVHQLRIDNIAERDINFVYLLGYLFPELDTSNETPHDYLLLLKDPRIRNLLGIKLRMTQDVLNNIEDLSIEIDKLIKMIDSQLN